MTRPTGDLDTWVVANTKGGTGKTTSAVHLAHALHELGRTVVAVDADPQQSMFKWHQASGLFPFHCRSLPHGNLHREVPGMAEYRYDTVVIDTPGTPPGSEGSRAITTSALRIARKIVIPIAPSTIEYGELEVMRGILDDIERHRPGDEPPPDIAVMLTRVVLGSTEPGFFRQMISNAGWRVLRAQVPNRLSYPRAVGLPLVGASGGPYGDGLREMMGAAA